MINRKYIIVLLLLIVGICAMTSVSASDNVTDVVASDADDVMVNIDEETSEVAASDVVTAADENENDVESQDVLASSENDTTLAQGETDDVLSAYSITSSQYTINLNDEYQISSKNGGKISYYLNPCQLNGYYAYNFYFDIYQGTTMNNLQLVKQIKYFYSDSMRTAGNYPYTFDANALAPGQYILCAVNYYDQAIMDTATLKVSGNAVITVTSGDYKSYYNSGDRMTVKVTDTSGKALKYINIKAVFTNGKTTKTKKYTTSDQGILSIIPPVGFGIWTVTFSPYDNHISAASVKKNVVIKKPAVAIKVYNVKNYEGLKVTLKAAVTTQGRKVNDGIVTFAFAGKTYKAYVEDGIASITVKLPKAKTYKYVAVFKGDNYKTSKKVSANAVSLKRYATKIVAKNIRAYRSTSPVSTYIAIRTTNGKIVNAGTVKINGETYELNKKGLVQITFPVDMTYVGMEGFYSTIYYKKAVTKTYTITYTPPSAKLKATATKIKFTQVYRCTSCGSTTSHRHSDGRTFIVS